MTIPAGYAKTTLVIPVPNIWIKEWKIQYRNVMELHQMAMEQIASLAKPRRHKRNISVMRPSVTKIVSLHKPPSPPSRSRLQSPSRSPTEYAKK